MPSPYIKIGPPARWTPVDWSELWNHRELVRVLVVRDLLGRYKQSLLGLGWFALQPIITALIFSFVFGRLVGIVAGGTAGRFSAAIQGWAGGDIGSKITTKEIRS